MNPRVPMGHLRTEIMSNSCDPQAWEHGGDEETADVARRKGTAPRRDGLRRGVRRDFGRWGQPAAPRPASPMVEFLKIMAKYGFRLQRGTGDQGGKTQYTHTVSISSYHKSICIGNGMAVASTQHAVCVCVCMSGGTICFIGIECVRVCGPVRVNGILTEDPPRPH